MWILGKRGKNKIVAFKMWILIRIKWVGGVRHDEVKNREKEGRTCLGLVKNRKAYWTEHTVREYS